MTVAIYLTIDHTGLDPADSVRSFRDGPLHWLKARGEIGAVDIFTPAEGDVPLFDDGPPPSLLVEIDVETTTDAEALIHSEDFRTRVCDSTLYGGRTGTAHVDVFEILNCPVPGHREPPARTAPLSFVVRYYGPTENENEFARIYTQNHPPLLALFPGIRNILCYVPVDVQLTEDVTSTGAFLGNEVVFDDLDALTGALRSDVIAKVIEDGETFPPCGGNTHYAMHRERVYTRSE